jgi:hypothetical protein
MSDQTPEPSPEQLQWILDHNQQIRAGHRYQLTNMVKAWQADRERLAAVRADTFREVEQEARRRSDEFDTASHEIGGEARQLRGMSDALAELADWCLSQREGR